MLIVCPHCASRYEIEAVALGGKGRPVRCGVCRTLWYVAMAEPNPLEHGASPVLLPSRLGFRQKLDAVVRVCSIIVMVGWGALTGFALTGEWPHMLLPMARSAGLESARWPELEGAVARLETTPDGATVLTIDAAWIGSVRTVAVPAVEFAVRNSENTEVARWTDRAGPTKLAAGQTVPFRSQFTIPGGDAREVRARYVGLIPDTAPLH
jgi:predicted Zn finger-like uncharacterized protein